MIESKTEVLDEKKKSNKGIVLFILGLILIILGLVSYICYDKRLILNDNKVESTEKKSDNTKKEVKLELDDSVVVKAENILSTITIGSTYGEISNSIASTVFSDKGLEFKNLNDNQKMLLAIKNSNANIISACGTDLTLDTVQANIDDDMLISSSIFEDSSYIDSFKIGKAFSLDQYELKYDNSRKSFAGVNHFCGRTGPNAYDSFKVTSAKKVNDELIIDINYSFFVPEGDIPSGNMDSIKYVIKATHDYKAESLGDATNNKMDENHEYEVRGDKCAKYQVKFKIDTDGLNLYINSIKKVDK